MTGRLRDKVIVVTGGARGIGRGCVELFAREGAQVVVGDIDRSGESLCRQIADAGGVASFQRTDITDPAQCGALIEHAVTRHGALHGLLNNVGWFPRATLDETTVELWDAVLNVNLRGAVFCTQHAVPHLRAAGGGSIVNMGSIQGLQAFPNLIAYGAAKGGLLTFTRTIAGAFSRDRIRANYVIPGWVLTETELALQHGRGVSDEELARTGRNLPLGRHQTAEDAAYACVYLLSDESSQVTGTVLNVDAGVSTLPNNSAGTYVG